MTTLSDLQGFLIVDANAVPGKCPPVAANGIDAAEASTASGVTVDDTAGTTSSARFTRCQHATMVFSMIAFVLSSLFATAQM